MPTVQTWVIIGLISVCISVITRIIAVKCQKDSVEIVALVLVPVIGFLFSDSDLIDTRAIVIAYSFVTYLISTAICHLVVWLVKKVFKNRSTISADSQQEGLTVMLPVNFRFSIDQNFIDNLPADVDSLAHMCNEIDTLTADFADKFPRLATDKERAEMIRSYFLGLCYHILDFFDDSVRVHVRILTRCSESQYIYDKFVATFNKNEYSRAMQPMSADNKMIQTSFKLEQSLIASLNRSLCEKGSRHKWKNFMTFALHSITYEGKPVFSMGISTAQAKTDRLFFLNYCSIETIIENYVDVMVNTADCKDFIIKHYFPSS